MRDESLGLVIEDDFDASVIFAKALEVLGFRTEQIAEGDKALARLQEVVPEVIVLDLHLPQVSGNNIIRIIRADERLKDTLVIVASADPRSADLIQDQADLVLIKPTTFSQVRDLAGRLTTARRRRREAERANSKEAENGAAIAVHQAPTVSIADSAAKVLPPENKSADTTPKPDA